jgi:hypothetical protein
MAVVRRLMIELGSKVLLTRIKLIKMVMARVISVLEQTVYRSS